MSSNDSYDEAARILTICNACRYCEGHCAVFPAIERRLTFSPSSIDYLSNLCHNCGSCYHHCQYAPPHEFDVNVPAILQETREQGYATYAWPRSLGFAFSRNGLWTSVIFMLLVAAFTFGTVFLAAGAPPEGRFYEVMPHGAMVTLFGSASILVLVAMAASLAGYWRAIGLPSPKRVGTGSILGGIAAALTLKNLDGGGHEGCTWPEEAPSRTRRVFHHLAFYGFIACFAATLTGTVYHYFLDWPAPYPLISLPKLLGTLGGLAIVAGVSGLAWLGRSSALPVVPNRRALGTSFQFLLLATSVTGLALMLLRETSWLGLSLGVHLASVLALFLSMPYGKFMHGLYRLVALIASEHEKRPRP